MHIKFIKKLSTLAAAAILLSSGVSAVFTDSVSTQTQNLNTGTGSLEITGGSLQAKATSSVEDLVPGDHVTRDLFLTNAASYDLASISLEVTDSETGQPLTSNPEGLQLTVERETGPGSWSVIYGPNAAPTGLVMGNIEGPALSAQGTDHLRFTQRFMGPDLNKHLKNKTAQLTYIFTGTQRDPLTPMSGRISTLASLPTNYNMEMVRDSQNNLYIREHSGNQVLKVDALTGATTRVVGTGSNGNGGDGFGPSIGIRIGQGSGQTRLAIDTQDNLYIADRENGKIRKYDPITQNVVTVAGFALGDTGNNGPALSARIAPDNIAIDTGSNILYFSTFNYKLRKVDLNTSIISHFAGAGTQGSIVDGTSGITATFTDLRNMSVQNGTLKALNRVSGAAQIVSLDLTTNIFSVPTSYIPATVLAYSTVYWLNSNKILLAFNQTNETQYRNSIIELEDPTNSTPRFLVSSKNVSASDPNGDGGLAIDAKIHDPRTVLLDTAGNVLILEYQSQKIRKIHS